MKHFFLTTLIALLLVSVISAQTVDSIKVEQAGDNILIHYQILQSNELQVFRVTLSCITSTGLKLEPKSLSGDFGDNITGGRTDYLIVWDVLKDMDELQSAEFSVKAELIKGKATYLKGPNLTGWDKKRFNIFLFTLIPGPKYGIKVGYMGKWGINFGFAQGGTSLNHEHSSISPPGDLPNKPLFSLDLTKRIVNRNAYQLHLYTGYANFPALFATRVDDIYRFENFHWVQGGMIMAYKRLTLEFGAYGPLMDIGKIEKDNDELYMSKDTHFSIGIGVRF